MVYWIAAEIPTWYKVVFTNDLGGTSNEVADFAKQVRSKYRSVEVQD